MTQGMSVQYSDNINSGNFFMNFAGVNVDLGVAPVAGTWHKVSCFLNAACTQALVYVDGVLKLTYTTIANLPTAGSGGFHVAMFIVKALGTTSRVMDVDRAYFKIMCAR